MSIELDIVPLAAAPTWGEVRRRWVARAGTDDLGPAAMLLLGTNEFVPESTVLRPPLASHFDLGQASTLSLMVMATAGVYDERDFLCDYGRNLSPQEVQALSLRWRSMGYFFALSSLGGRPPSELRRMIALATALAEAVDGRVVLPHSDVFNKVVGVYTYEAFAVTEPR